MCDSQESESGMMDGKKSLEEGYLVLAIQTQKYQKLSLSSKTPLLI